MSIRVHIVTEVQGAAIYNNVYDTKEKAARKFKELVESGDLKLPVFYQTRDSIVQTDDYEVRVEYDLLVE